MVPYIKKLEFYQSLYMGTKKVKTIMNLRHLPGFIKSKEMDINHDSTIQHVTVISTEAQCVGILKYFKMAYISKFRSKNLNLGSLTMKRQSSIS